MHFTAFNIQQHTPQYSSQGELLFGHMQVLQVCAVHILIHVTLKVDIAIDAFINNASIYSDLYSLETVHTKGVRITAF